ncbi:MAG: response regulator transcription factor [Planctomycetales bacterium]|nr:response regulator transcription factor [Planctomycetales bacterium]
MTTLMQPAPPRAKQPSETLPHNPARTGAEPMSEARSEAEQKLKATIFVIDDDEATRNAVSEMFQPSQAGVRAYESAEAFLKDFVPNGPSCLLLDERLPGISGSQLLKQLARDGVCMPAVVVTAHASTPTTVEAMRHGAITVIEKPCADSVLEAAVNRALEQDARRLTAEAPRRLARQRLSELTTSEMQVLAMVLDGVPNKQIASRLGVCVRTIEARRSKIYQTAKVSSVAELVRMCVTAGVVDA